MKTTIPTLALLLPCAAFAGDAKAPIPAAPTAHDGWQWSVSGGPAWHNMGRLTYTGRSRSQSLALPSFVGNDSLTVPPVGDEAAVGERFYNDGYVRQDASTPIDGNTWFWGYENASQIVPVRAPRVGGAPPAGDLVYHATGYRSIRNDAITTRPGLRDEKDLQEFGFEIRADVLTPWRLGPFRVGGMIGIGAVSENQSLAFSNHTTVQTRDDYRLDYTDRYHLGGIIPPAAPYHGTLAGPGPIIPNIPANRVVTPVLLTTDTAVLTNKVRADFRDDSFALTLAPSLNYNKGLWNFMVAGGVILEFHNYSTRQYEQLNVASATVNGPHARWAEGDSGTKFRPGLFLQAGVQYDVGNNWHIGGWARGEIADDFSVAAGPSLFKFEPVGYTLGFELGYNF